MFEMIFARNKNWRDYNLRFPPPTTMCFYIVH